MKSGLGGLAAPGIAGEVDDGATAPLETAMILVKVAWQGA